MRIRYLVSRLMPVVAIAGVIAGVVAGCASGQPKSSEALSNQSGSAIQAIRPGQSSAGLVRFFGYVDVVHDIPAEGQYIEARFGQFAHSVAASVVMAAFTSSKAGRCETTRNSGPIEIQKQFELTEHEYQFVSAGPAIRINHAGRKYIDLIPETKPVKSDRLGEMITYSEVVDGLKVTFGGLKLFDAQVRTGNLQVNIPGDQFPAMGPLAVPEVAKLKGFNLSESDRVKAGTEFKWRAGNNPQAQIGLGARSGGRIFLCTVPDTGSFKVPRKVKRWLAGRSLFNAYAYREAIVFYRSGDAIVAVSQSTQY